MSNMTTKSDFAQKLLSDLRQRKERMVPAQNSSRHSGQASRVMHGNSAQTSRSARRLNAVESAGSTTGNTSRRSMGSSRSANMKESSNQMVVYGHGQNNNKQFRDLSMAIAFAFENNGNLSKIGGSSSNPLVNFFNRFGRRSANSQKMEITTLTNQGPPNSRYPTVSHIHITEISNGVHKLNQILRACSNGVDFDRNSIEIGKELLKGAIDLEESLRMLVNLQNGSDYVSGSQKKSRIKLLEEDEDEEEDNNNNNKLDVQWKLDRPRFSFDKPSRRRQYPQEISEQPQSNSKLVLHERSTSYIQDLSLSIQVNNNPRSTSEKGRISNVIAKLMGLEEIPLNEGSKCMKNDSKGKVSKENIKSREHSIREGSDGSHLSTTKKSTFTINTTQTREPRLQLKPEKSKRTPDGASERNQQKDLKLRAVGMEVETISNPAIGMMNDRQSHSFAANQVNGLQSFEDSRRKQSKVSNSESKVLVSNSEQQKKTQNSKKLKAAHTRHSSIDLEISVNSTEKWDAERDHQSNQQKHQDQHTPPQEQVTKRAELSEDKRRVEQKGQKFQKHLMVKTNEGQQVESKIAPKPKKSAAINGQKKLLLYKSSPGNGGSMKPTEKILIKDPPNRRNQDTSFLIDITQKTASDQERKKNADQGQNLSIREPEVVTESSNKVLKDEKQNEVQPPKKISSPRKVQRTEISQKMDVLITRRNATVNHLERSFKKPANLFNDLKKQMHNKDCSSKRKEEQSDSQVKEGKSGTSARDVSELTSEEVKLKDKLKIEDDQTFKESSTSADDCQLQIKQSLNDNCENVIINSGEVLDDLQTLEQPFIIKDEEELKQCDQSTETHEERIELHYISQNRHKQSLTSKRVHEQLTEPEKYLKETLIKSQLFLSTAEALFKLNIPLSFLHAGDHGNETAGTKLVLDCAYEVMKRKARRQEIEHNPYTKTTISRTKIRSFDNLVKQLCRDLEMLKLYGMNATDECDVAAGLYKMLNRDIYNENPDVNTMWDFEWTQMMSVFPQMEDVVKDVERHLLNGLLDEITKDFLLI